MQYEINKDTLAILPIYDGKAKIIEKDAEYIIDLTPYKIMETSCEYFGSSLEGRLSGSKNMLGTVYKAPIVVEESRNIIFFPTKSPLTTDNGWISLNNILSFEKTNSHETNILFRNNRNLVVPIPFPSIENQVLRGARLESIMRQRKF